MRIAVFGTGGVGGYFGGRLAHAGEDVAFIARGKHLEALRSDGLRVDSTGGDFHVHPVVATDDPADIGLVDHVLVAVKAWQVPDAARRMPPLIGEDTAVVPFENGVEAPEHLAEVIGETHVLGGLCVILASLSGPGHVTHAGYEPAVAFGELDNRPSRRAEELRDAFIRAGVKADVPQNIHVAMWRKFLFITGFSGVAAVARLPVGGWRQEGETKSMLLRAFQEVEAVARAKEIDLPPDAVEAAMGMIDSLPDDGIASMQRDIMQGRPSELEAQTGAVVRFGRNLGVRTPVNEFIYAALLPQERKARSQIAG